MSPACPPTMPISHRAASFQESVIREMTRLHAIHGGVNLAQGYPDFDPPQEILDAACRAIREGYNQYAITWGSPRLREAVARHATEFNRIPTDPAANVTVCCGATETMIATLMAVCNPGDEVIVFTPYYENYGPDAILSGAVPVYVPLHPSADTWTFDPEELARAFSERTRAIIVNTPHNPTGHVFTRAELQAIADLCLRHDCLAITDEIYEHILYDGREHVSITSLDGMQERTVTISGASKTFSVTGWRLGWAIAPKEISTGIRRVHDFLTVGAPHPLQEAAVAALELPPRYYRELVEKYTDRRDRVVRMVRKTGLVPYTPEGAYYTLADTSAFDFPDDVALTMHLVRDIGVAVVPGSSFFPPGSPRGKRLIRFAFPKRDETLD
ncbi:MAG TPA: aminotransferase class I/II-fold pyridoxal phosphate-dependent enzyme, partial [Armatimonadota bacterium]|nr:aminotransferase class I/II-fold pyridoxal phosphate-dependent enzyme [Armatimonadota bacterium]